MDFGEGLARDGRHSKHIFRGRPSPGGGSAFPHRQRPGSAAPVRAHAAFVISSTNRGSRDPSSRAQSRSITITALIRR
jgi:hypothetical protein